MGLQNVKKEESGSCRVVPSYCDEKNCIVHVYQSHQSRAMGKCISAGCVESSGLLQCQIMNFLQVGKLVENRLVGRNAVVGVGGQKKNGKTAAPGNSRPHRKPKQKLKLKTRSKY